MYLSLFNLRDNQTNVVSLTSVIRRDLIPWLASGFVVVLVYYGMAAIVSGAIPSSQKHALDLSLVTLYQQQLLVYILIFCGCFLAYRGLTARTWITFAFLVICITPQYYSSVINTLFPNSMVACMVSMMGIMAAFRLIEYYDLRFNMHIENLYIAKAPIIAYLIIIFIAICCQIPYRHLT